MAGSTENYAWDVLGRLQSVSGPDETTQFAYDSSGQRLLRRAPNGRVTIYVAGHEVSANADGTGLSAVRLYTFGEDVVAERTRAGLSFLVTGPAGCVELAIPSGGSPAGSRTCLPYGRNRSKTGTIATDRGFVGQVEDASTKLSYLNARYYDATAGIFLSPDAVMDTTKVKSLNPFSYANNNPTTFADASGNFSAYTFGLERANAILRDQNKAPIAHIGFLNSQISELQNVILQQRRLINELFTYIDALQAEIARQQTIIEQLQARVRYLERH